MITLDRYLGMHFFTNDLGGNMMMYANLFWTWGHPEVYIVILPAFGIFSEVVATFSGKRLFGYGSMVYATAVITILSFSVWVHHFFTMGASPNVNLFFGIATMLIAIPTGVKIFNWLFTMYRGRIRFTTPMYWTLGFIVTFAIGGSTGVLMAVPPADYVLHNSLFLIAHFHNVLIPGALFGFFAGYYYWFPKAFGFRLQENWGKRAFWCWLIGFYLAFVPLYVLGFMGMPRRMAYYPNPAWHPYLLVAALGTAVIALGILFQGIQLFVSIKERQALSDPTGDPWDGRTLEWLTSSPPAVYNFPTIPVVDDNRCLYGHEGKRRRLPAAGALSRHRDAEKRAARLDHRRLGFRVRLCRDLVHLVAGHPCRSGYAGHGHCPLAATTTSITSYPPPRSSGSKMNASPVGTLALRDLPPTAGPSQNLYRRAK